MLNFTNRTYKYLSTATACKQRSLVGGKAFNLAALESSDFAIPSWFVVTTQAFADSAPPQFLAATANVDLPLADLQLDAQLKAELLDALKSFPADTLFAVRSSAQDEDNSNKSFAGQLDSYLCVSVNDVPARVLDVWRSAFSQRVLAYRKLNQENTAAGAPAVIVQEMVPAEKAGVAFSVDPISSAPIAVISSVFGLGESLVSGETDADTYHVDLAGNITSSAGQKTVVRKQTPAGLQIEELKNPDTRLTLSDSEIGSVAALVRKVEKHFGCPQDIEWAITSNGLFLLQARPITTCTQKPSGQGQLNIWDNSNIGESYAGITTPMTYSFARKAYEHVYIQFCRLMGLTESVIRANQNIFPHMLGLIRGRIYYNLLNWYRLIAILPGYKSNRKFMEQMMGVREELPLEVVPQSQPLTFVESLQDRINLTRSAIMILWRLLVLNRDIDDFNNRFEKVLEDAGSDFAHLELDELATRYRQLEAKLLPSWDAPLVNDFFAMIFYGSLRSLTAKWCNDQNGTLQNDLVAGEGGIISTEPARLMNEAALLASSNPHLVNALASGSQSDIAVAAGPCPEFEKLMTQYFKKFGGRCIGELKLESANLKDDPMPMYRTLGRIAQRGLNNNGASDYGAQLRLEAEATVQKCLAGHPIRKFVFNHVLTNARARVKKRENLRFQRTRLFALVRELINAMAARLVTYGVIDDSKSVYYLEVEELLGYIEGTASCTDLRNIIAVKKKEFEGYQLLPAPPDRLETHGPIYLDSSLSSYDSIQLPIDINIATDGILKGTGCCKGVVKAKVRVIFDPREAPPLNGDILVAKRTDPGWIMVFPQASGILVEYGSLLSHSAIVSRELGIPAIVGIPNLTSILHDGDVVEFDGATGVIKILREETLADSQLVEKQTITTAGVEDKK